MVPVASVMALAAVLFCLGLFGALSKRSLVVVLISVELMLNAVNLNFVALSRYGFTPDIAGQVFALFNMTIAAAEVAVGLAILLALFRSRNTSDVEEMDELKH